MANIAFIGLGNMGGPMAANLVKMGHNVAGYDTSAEALAAATQAGVAVKASLADAAAGADMVITMLPNGKLVLQCLQGAGGLLAHAPRGALFIDSSTIDVTDARAAHAAAGEACMAVVDAPVSGGTMGAAAGTLTFMVGGDAAAFARAQPI